MSKQRRPTAADRRATLGAFLPVFDDEPKNDDGDTIRRHGADAAQNTTSMIDGSHRHQEDANRSKDPKPGEWAGHGSGTGLGKLGTPGIAGPPPSARLSMPERHVDIGNSLSVSRHGAAGER
jgi:hypothetical protein